MADLEIFTWCVQKDVTSTEAYRTRSAQFGDGYKQVVADGINSVVSTWNVSVTGKKELILEVRNFLRRHAGYKSFRWTEPLGEVVLVRASEGPVSSLGGGIFTISTTFEQAFTQDS